MSCNGSLVKGFVSTILSLIPKEVETRIYERSVHSRVNGSAGNGRF